ncbi:MAG: ECF transporter S component [Tissierellales bacterium]|nr:ECF transporter S component [Tissierellales bacterium]MBN2827281.1 ECF transporter S component [Tissierellales bacterium]
MNKILKDTRKLTFLGVMLALTIAFVAITAIPTASASMALLLFIPTIVTGIVMGPKAGALMGFCAGLATLLRGLLAPLSPFDLFFINPLVSVLPRTFIGIASYYVYTLLKSLVKNEKISILIAGASGAIVNTAFVMTMLYFIYAKEIADLVGAPFKVLLLSIITSNAIIEAVVAALLTLPVVLAYQKIYK